MGVMKCTPELTEAVIKYIRPVPDQASSITPSWNKEGILRPHPELRSYKQMAIVPVFRCGLDSVD